MILHPLPWPCAIPSAWESERFAPSSPCLGNRRRIAGPAPAERCGESMEIGRLKPRLHRLVLAKAKVADRDGWGARTSSISREALPALPPLQESGNCRHCFSDVNQIIIRCTSQSGIPHLAFSGQPCQCELNKNRSNS